MKGAVQGHEVYHDGKQWYWQDTKQPVKGNPRNCAKCGKPSTPEGYDACIGKIDGAIGVCCGHGRHTGYIQWPGSDYPSGWKRGVRITESDG